MLQAVGLSYTVDPRFDPLFEGLSLSLLPGEKVALMGPNGAGKTTLLRLLTGELKPSAGQVIRSRGCQIAYLPQDFDRDFTGSLGDFVEDATDHHLARFGLLDRLDQDYHTFSPGEKMRAALARLIAADPDLLLLDEPTNHLDLEARLWLEEFLDRSRQGVLMVCHDRAMVNAVVGRVVELERGQTVEYTGGYDDMKRQKEERIAREMSAWERERHEAKRLKNAADKTMQRAARMVNKSRIRNYDVNCVPFYNARAKGVDKRAKAIRSRVSHLEANATAKPFIGDDTALSFPAQPMHSSYPLTVRGLRKSFDRPLFDALNLDLERGQRIALVGPNGCGKTTLMRILLGEEPSDGGEIFWTSDARPAYLSQTRTRLALDLPLIEALAPETPKEEQFVRNLLGRLKIRGDAILKEVGVLSVGERTKAELVKMLMSTANVLLLDEPTNHLDIESLEALEEALTEFPGSVLFTSHDRAFIDRAADDVLELT